MILKNFSLICYVRTKVSIKLLPEFKNINSGDSKKLKLFLNF